MDFCFEDLEQRCVDAGHAEGFAKGDEEGAAEGRLVGLAQGKVLGHELGYYAGVIAVLRLDASDRAKRALDSCAAKIHDDFTDVDAIRTLFRAAMAHCGYNRGQRRSFSSRENHLW
mmetsp:Transcript_37973/g.121867  ORF Transcript_37973/g.121867 Transcript_37973/m.121867 type:complete len:116 (-) Transcript_37973:970-1317(-)